MISKQNTNTLSNKLHTVGCYCICLEILVNGSVDTIERFWSHSHSYSLQVTNELDMSILKGNTCCRLLYYIQTHASFA